MSVRLDLTYRKDALYQALAARKALREEGEVGACHLDHVTHGDDDEHEAELEPLHDVCCQLSKGIMELTCTHDLEEVLLLELLEHGCDVSSHSTQATHSP